MSLDGTSRIGLHVKRYWGGMDEARYVIRDGDSYYISEYNFGGAAALRFYVENAKGRADHKAPKVDPTESGLSRHTESGGGGVTFGIDPTETRWVRYDPKAPYDIVFASEDVVYEKHEFSDVQVAGFYIAQHKWTLDACAAKWYGFEVWGTVHRPERPSENLAMSHVSGAKCQVSGQEVQIPAFYTSRCEIPYVLYQKIRRWGVAPQYVFDDYYPYITDNDGDMGSMDYGPGGKLLSHGPDEPVTDITWLDAVVWCNMLSEYEGREPVYYYSPDFKHVFRRARERRLGTRNRLFRPRVYVKWDADGYRLPTLAEWTAARGQRSEISGQKAWIGENSKGTTHDVGTSEPNELGVCDMLGNVWEYVWDAGQAYDSSREDFCAEHTVVGGDFSAPADPWTRHGNVYGDEPHKGHFGIGFRVVRRKKGLPAAPVSEVSTLKSEIPKWTFREDQRGTGAAPNVSEDPILKMVSIPESHYRRYDKAKVFVSPFHMAKHETNYAKWKEVYDWAVTRGYVFN